MKTLRKILSSPMVGIRWVKALELASNEDYQAALDYLDYLDQFFNGKNIEYHLLRGLVNYGLGNDSEAAQNFNTSIVLLNNTERYSEDERSYLMGYGAIFGSKALKANPSLIEKISFPGVDISLIDLSKVRQSLKKNFPLRNHPNWKDENRGQP